MPEDPPEGLTFNPDAPGVPDITTGFKRLLKARYSDTPGLLERYAELLETEKGKSALALIIRGADKLARSGANAPFLLRFIAQSIRSARAQGVGSFELNEWPDTRKQADGERGIIIDMKTRQRVN